MSEIPFTMVAADNSTDKVWELAVKSQPALREEGANIILVLTIVDRLEGAAETFAAENLRFRALYTADEFLKA